MADRASAHILALLDHERAAIRNADYETLDQLAAEKETLFRALNSSNPDKADLATIKKRLDENQKLLAAAIKGVTDAQGRLSAMRQVREELSVYDQTGHVSKVQTRRSELEKKA